MRRANGGVHSKTKCHLIPKSRPLLAHTLKGRKIGILVIDRFDAKLLAALRDECGTEQAVLSVVVPKNGGVTGDDNELVEPDFALSGGPSFFFDAVVVLPSEEGCKLLTSEASAVDWVRDAFGHLKVIGFTEAARELLDAGSVVVDDGVLLVNNHESVTSFMERAKAGRRWEREPTLRSIG